MACWTGITNRPQRRRANWERTHATLQNWQIVSTHKSRTDAWKAERALAEQLGSASAPGDSGPEFGKWYVYSFEY